MKAPLILVLCFSFFTSSAQVNPPDSMILVEFYHALDGDNWTNNDGWLTNKPINEWYGVISENGEVINLHLQANNLKGEIPSGIGDLGRLRELRMNNNQISGPIPLSIGKLKSLQKIEFQRNQISGPLPDEMGRCSDLILINFLENQVSHLSDSLVRCKQLRELYAGENALTRFPQWIGEMSKIEALWLHENEIEDTIPSDLGNLSKMRHLLLYRNKIYGELPSLKNMTELKRLYVMQNQMQGDITDLLPDSSQISDFRIYDNDFTGHIAGHSFREGVLEKFWISNNQISSLGDFSGFSNLNLAFLNHNHLNISDLLQFTDKSIPQFQYGGQANRGQAMDLEVAMDTTITLSTDADGAGTKYQWQKNGLWITGENASELTISNFSEEDNGTYDCFATNPRLPGFFLYTEKVKLKLRTTVSTDDDMRADVRVYPNPAEDFIMVETEKPCRMRWMDVEGRVMGLELRLEVGVHRMTIPPSLMNSQVLLIEMMDNEGRVHVVKLIHD